MVSFGLSSFRNNNNTINGQRRSSSSSSSSSARISPLHSKGMLILALVLLTESVTLTNAVRSVEAASGGSSFFGGPSASTTTSESSTCTMGSSSCPPTAASSSSSSQGGLPPIKNTLGAIGKRFIKNKSGASSIAECCKDFHRCSTSQHSAPASSLLEECDFLKGIPRGGHVSSSSSATDAIIGGAAAAAAAVTATKNMPYNIPLNGWKIIFQIFLTTINVVCWLVPLKSKSFGENKLALSLANAFSGGVFLSLAFGHLIPECVHGFSSNTGGLVGGLMSNEATPYMLVLSGYMLIFFVEKVAFDAHGALHEMEHAQDNKVKVKGNNNNKNGVVVANGKNNKDPAQQHNSGRSAVILLAALAVHSILEMAALGLSDTFSDSALLTISIALHQVRCYVRFLLYVYVRVAVGVWYGIIVHGKTMEVSQFSVLNTNHTHVHTSQKKMKSTSKAIYAYWYRR